MNTRFLAPPEPWFAEGYWSLECPEMRPHRPECGFAAPLLRLSYDSLLHAARWVVAATRCATNRATWEKRSSNDMGTGQTNIFAGPSAQRHARSFVSFLVVCFFDSSISLISGRRPWTTDLPNPYVDVPRATLGWSKDRYFKIV